VKGLLERWKFHVPERDCTNVLGGEEDSDEDRAEDTSG
jgi:hypothetical protein